MKVTGLYFRNLLGIRELRIATGTITRIHGANGTGKSSILAGAQAALGGGNLETLRRVGSEEPPEVVLVVDDGAMRVERKGDAAVAVKQRVGDSQAYEKIRRGQAHLDSLFDPYATNPLTFLNARPMDRADLMLKALPLELDRAELLGAIGETWPKDKALPEGMHPLPLLELVRGVLYDERTGVNRTQKDKAASAYELQKALPAKWPDDPAQEQRKAAEARDAIHQRITERRGQAEAAAAAAKAAAQAEFAQADEREVGEFKAATARLRRELAEKVAALEAETNAAVETLRQATEERRDAAEAALNRTEVEAEKARAAALADVDAMVPDLQDAERKLGEVSKAAQDLARLEETRRLAAQFEAEAEDLKAQADAITRALETVDRFKAGLVKGLPVHGLEVRGKEIFVGGVPFDQLNTAKRISIAVQVAMMRARGMPLPLVFVDGAEALDPELREHLENELAAAGVQAVVAYRDDGELRVETREPEPPAAAAAEPPPVLTPPPAPGEAKPAARRTRKPVQE